MKPIYKVIVPVDFSPTNHKAFEFLEMLRQKADLEIHLVHVIEVDIPEVIYLTESLETNHIPNIELLAQLASFKMQQLGGQLNFSFWHQILLGSLSHSLTHYAARYQVDLVVMGLKGKEGWLDQLAGSAAQHLVAQVELPIISIRQAAEVSPIEHIAWVADFTAQRQPARAIAFIKKLQKLFGARIHLLQIIEKQQETQIRDIKQRMLEFANDAQLKHYEIHLQRDYQVPAGVRSFNQQTAIDLVTIDTHAAKLMQNLLHNSIPDTLLNRCIKPLLTCHLG